MADTGQMATGRHGVLYRFGCFELHATEFRLRIEGITVPLEPKALHLLLFLVTRPGRLVRKQELLDELWPDVAVTDNALTRCVTLLRRALADDSRTPTFIETVPKAGYRFIAPVTVEVVPGTLEVAPAQPAAYSVPDIQSADREASRHSREQNAASDMPLHTLEQPDLFTAAVAPIRSQTRMGLLASSLIAATLVVVASVTSHRPAAASTNKPPRAGVVEATTRPDTAANMSADDAVSTEAREQYQRGLYFYDRRNGTASAAAFRKAIELAPRYSPAYAGLALALATSYTVDQQSVVPEAIRAAKTAIALDRDNGEAYIALGCLQTTFTWEWREAEANLTHGLQLSPQNATGHIWYAVLLQAQGHQDEAIAQAGQAVAIAPLSFYMVRMQASVLYFARRYEDALRILERAREMQPQHPNVVDNWISWANEQRGLYDDAVAHDLLAMEDRSTPGQLAALRVAYRRSGWRGYWQMRLDQMPPQSRQGCGLYSAGVAYLRVGDREQALAALHEAALQHCFWMGMVRVDPALDSVRQDLRFQQVEQMVGGGDTPATVIAHASAAPVR